MAKQRYTRDNPGQPPIFDTPEAMQLKIDEYFEYMEPKILKDDKGQVLTDRNGKPVYEKYKKPSVVGLALYLGYASRQSLYDNDKGEFSYIIKRAKARIEEKVLMNTSEGDVPTALGIFLLKQFGYTDKQEIQHSGEMSIGRPPSLEDAEFPE